LLGAGSAPAGALLADPIDVVMADGVMYMRIPVLGDYLGDAEWVKLDLGALAASGADGSTADSLLGGSGVSSLSDPATYLDFLRGASAGITDEGHEDVDGVDTTHLHATVDIDKALAELAGTEYEALDSMRDSLGGLTEDLAMIPVDVWIDGDGHVRRFTVAIALPAIPALPGTESTESTDSTEQGDDSGLHALQIDLRFSKFGDDVDIQVPDNAFDVMDTLSGLAEKLPGS
jgi:hypothetical protein